jgi:hypothetical protein
MGFFSRQPKVPAEQIYAVPLAARKLSGSAAPSHEIYVYYAFVSAESPDQALDFVRTAVRDDGYEFIELTGRIIFTNRADWDGFVGSKFGWMKESLPTGRQLDKFVRGVVHYSPKIVRM